MCILIRRIAKHKTARQCRCDAVMEAVGAITLRVGPFPGHPDTPAAVIARVSGFVGIAVADDADHGDVGATPSSDAATLVDGAAHHGDDRRR